MDAVPDFLEPIIAWRGWNIHEMGRFLPVMGPPSLTYMHEVDDSTIPIREEAFLTSITRPDIWPVDGWFDATCLMPPPVQDVRVDVQRPTQSFYSWQSNRPVMTWQGPVQMTIQMTLVGREPQLQEELRRGITVRLAPSGSSIVVQGSENPDPPPHPDHHCGIYAVTRRKDIPSAQLIGAVELSGKVIPGDQGYRAQRARPIAFQYRSLIGEVKSWHQKMSILSERYNVPIVMKLPTPTDPEEVRRREHREGD